MKSHKLFHNRFAKQDRIVLRDSKGFTLIEILVVVGLAAAIAAAGYVVSIGSFQRSTFSSDRDLTVSLLQKARSRALANMNESEQGVVILTDRIVVFEDSFITNQSFDDPDEIVNEVPLEDGVTYGGDTEFLFEQLSGSEVLGGAENALIMTGVRPDDSVTITVYENGRIDWIWN